MRRASLPCLRATTTNWVSYPGSDRASSQAEAERLLVEARESRETAVSEAKGVEASLSKWQEFAENPKAALHEIDEKPSRHCGDRL